MLSRGLGIKFKGEVKARDINLGVVQTWRIFLKRKDWMRSSGGECRGLKTEAQTARGCGSPHALPPCCHSEPPHEQHGVSSSTYPTSGDERKYTCEMMGL